MRMAESTPVTPFNDCEHTPTILDLVSSSKCGKTGHCHVESRYTESKWVQTLDKAGAQHRKVYQSPGHR